LGKRKRKQTRKIIRHFNGRKEDARTTKAGAPLGKRKRKQTRKIIRHFNSRKEDARTTKAGAASFYSI
jgi:hypothetical protein